MASNRFPAAVLWDMDGTIVDTEPYWIQAEHEIVEAAGGTWSDEYAHQLVGNDLMVSAEFIKAHSPVELSPLEIIDALLERVVAQVRQHVPWRPGAREALQSLAAEGIPSALVTMSWRSLADAVVSALPEGTFTVVVTGDQVTHGKPHPEPYATACAALGVRARDCLAIEDSPTGVKSAVAAGVPTLAVPHVVPVPEIVGAVQRTDLVGLSIADMGQLVESVHASRQ